eukprot:TRINITY_DN60237_c0_g1_i2.p1 TRINITY_DN60237_c0_g1~~TRINITY_DN60237_c0_g1_i2.p1  ORF type:complete len:210 (-),score=19.69 TRINITY_DN60237_c0_g1_i2:136-765(-)
MGATGTLPLRSCSSVYGKIAGAAVGHMATCSQDAPLRCEKPAAAAERLAPRSASSAMPDPNSDTVPRLQAKVHQRLTPAECARIKPSDITFRALRADDYAEMIALHTEWFPVSYDDNFYQRSVSGELYTLVATYPCGAGHQAASENGDRGSSGSEDILGMVTMSTSCEHHGGDIDAILGGDCAACCRPSQSQAGDVETGSVAYILMHTM